MLSGFKRCSATLLLLLAACSSGKQDGLDREKLDKQPSPNILLIVADDLGYADLGFMGSEIRTPVLDSLAARGTTFTDYYVAAGCSPTRSMLMSGTTTHMAGIGAPQELLGQVEPLLPVAAEPTKTYLGQIKGRKGYEGHLTDRTHILPKMLHDAGYNTYMSGKWHLGFEEKKQWPVDRGFDRSFALLNGASSNFSDNWEGIPSPIPVQYVRNDKRVEVAKDFYSSTTYATEMIAFIDEGLKKDPNRPFFGYLSFTAPHDPLQVPDEDLNLYNDKYEAGWDAIRQNRIASMKERGFFPAGAAAAKQLEEDIAPRWSSLSREDKAKAARSMEIYAAMVERMDREIGRVIDHLKTKGELENTIVMFMSDNGAAVASLRPMSITTKENDFDLDGMKSIITAVNNDIGNYGKMYSFLSYKPGWSGVSNGPLAFFKGSVGEGSFRTPLIVAGPGITANQRTAAIGHVMDLLPTFLEIAKADIPKGGATNINEASPDNRAAIQGVSLWPVMQGKRPAVRTDKDMIVWELIGGRAVRQGNLKLRMIQKPFGSGEWEVYDLVQDPGETFNVAAQYPEQKAAMIAAWNEYAKNNNVIIAQTQQKPSG
jgi:arylsulfatase A-like enzyme